MERGTRGLGPRGRATRGRKDARTRGHGDAGTRERGPRKHWNSGTRGLEDVIYKQHLIFALNICKAQFLEFSRKVLHHFSARERAEFNKSCNLICPWSGRNFLIRTATAGGICRVELARAADVMVARAKRIFTLIIKVSKLFSFCSLGCFLKEIVNIFFVFLSSYRNTRESFRDLEKAVETLACGSYSHSRFCSPKLPLVFLLNN